MMGKMENHPKVINICQRGDLNRHLTRSIPHKVSLPLEPIWEESVVNNTVHESVIDETETIKNSGLNKRQKIKAVGILCGDRPCKFCDSKAVFFTYLSLSTEGRQIFGSQELTVQNDQLSTKRM